MSTETISLGPYVWSRPDGSTRPMWGSSAHLEAMEEFNKQREQDLLTPEGQEWLARHGEI
jgi:hypothetical protein